nr:hypothetical protein Q903MT_gene2352 [Picea sitchensis]
MSSLLQCTKNNSQFISLLSRSTSNIKDHKEPSIQLRNPVNQSFCPPRPVPPCPGVNMGLKVNCGCDGNCVLSVNVPSLGLVST